MASPKSNEELRKIMLFLGITPEMTDEEIKKLGRESRTPSNKNTR